MRIKGEVGAETDALSMMQMVSRVFRATPIVGNRGFVG